MPPQVIVVLFMLMFGFVYMIMSKKQQHELQKLDKITNPNKTDNSLTTGELEGMIRTAVEQANAPLLDRMKALEDRMAGVEDAEAQEGPLLDDPADSYVAGTKTMGRVPRERS